MIPRHSPNYWPLAVLGVIALLLLGYGSIVIWLRGDDERQNKREELRRSAQEAARKSRELQRQRSVGKDSGRSMRVKGDRRNVN